MKTYRISPIGLSDLRWQGANSVMKSSEEYTNQDLFEVGVDDCMVHEVVRYMIRFDVSCAFKLRYSL